MPPGLFPDIPSRRTLAECLALALGAILVSMYLHSPWLTPNIYSDIWSFWGRSWVAAGQVPYSSAAAFLEYPPVSGALLYASRILGGAIGGISGGLYAGYYLSFSAFSLVAAGALAWSTWRLAKGLGVDLNPLYFLLPSMFIYGVYNFDLFDALFVVLTLQLFVEKRRDLSAAALGVAIATKFVGAVLLPILLLELGGWKVRARYFVVAGICAGLIFLPIAVYNPGYFGQFLSFYSSWGLEDAWYIWIFGNQFSVAAKWFGYVLLALLLLRVYTLKMRLVPKSFLAIAAYFLATYIYAPQFNLTLIPLVAVLAVTSPALYSWEVFNALIILTWFIYPDPTHVWTIPQAVALVRSASLGVLALSMAAGEGHSLVKWVRARGGGRPPPDPGPPE
jgi:hypothetical protein